MKHKGWWLFGIIIILIIVILIFLGWYYFFEYKIKCGDKTCFTQSLVECKKAIFVNQDSQTITQYQILGQSNGNCQTNVEIIQVKKGASDLSSLEGLDMNCFTPIGSSIMPESNTKNCHGLLKEAIQEVVINRMYSEIVQNLGKISEETTKIL